MGKIKLDLDKNDNLDFDRTVSIPETTEKKHPLRVTFTFKYRDSIEAADFFDSLIEKGRALVAAERERVEAGGEPKTMKQMRTEAIKRDVDVIKDIATGWNIDAPFDEVELTKFFTKYPGAGTAIAQDYRVSVSEGRLGN